jgi:outer membrane protein assembly factor BamB
MSRFPRWPLVGAGLLGLLSLAAMLQSAPGDDKPKDKPKDDEVFQTEGAWLVYRGNPTMTGVAATKLPDKLAELWKFATADSIESAPAVWDGKVFVGSMDEHLYALDLKSGAQLWKKKYGPFKAPPGVHGGRVYVGDADGLFYCVDAATGAKKWSIDTKAEIESGPNFYKDKILFGSYDESLYCVSADGKVEWTFKTNGPVNSSPTIAGDFSFVAGCDSQLHVIDLRTGKEKASVDLEGQAAATAAVIGDRLYVGTMTNQVKGIDWKKAAVLWTFEAETRAQAFYGSAAVTDELVIAGSRDKRIWALSRKTGKPVWSVPTGGKVDASPVVVGNRVYVGSLDGNLYVLDVATGRQVQKIALDGPISASAAVVSGRLLVGTQKGTLYCFGKK